jgi:predicted secreted acid phosphatase
MKRLIICDIDGTILTNERRHYETFVKVTGKKPDFEAFKKVHWKAKEMLTPEQHKKYQDLNALDDYVHLDTPIEGAREVLKWILSKGYTLVYVTGRHHNPASGDSMMKGTMEWMQKNGFPVPDNNNIFLIMKEHRDHDDLGFKVRVAERIKEMGLPIAGIGDMQADAIFYSKLGVPALIFDSGDVRSKPMPGGVVWVKTWKDVMKWIMDNV